MGKTIILGDTHHRAFWKRITLLNHCDKVVFLGDFFDSMEIPMKDGMDNFLDIIEFKKVGYPEVVLLTGNHDHANYCYGGICSGHNETYRKQIRYLLEENKDHFRAAYEQGGILFTHAGVTKTWLKTELDLLEEETRGEVEKMSIADKINWLWKNDPRGFNFQERNHYVDPYGNNTFQGPLWIRPQSLMKDGIEGVVQIVGHTQQDRIVSKAGGKFWFIDALPEYLIIENDIITVGK